MIRWDFYNKNRYKYQFPDNIEDIPNSFSRNDMFKILPKHSIGLELGTARGELAQIMLRIVQPQKLHIVDNWTKDLHYDSETNRKLFFEKFDYNHPVVTIHEMDSLDAVSLFENEYFDWIYIDCNHFFEAVYNDYKQWRCKVKNDGWIMGHDYYDLKPEHGGDNVVKAVNKLIYEEGLYEIKYIATEPFCSIGLKKVGPLP